MYIHMIVYKYTIVTITGHILTPFNNALGFFGSRGFKQKSNPAHFARAGACSQFQGKVCNPLGSPFEFLGGLVALQIRIYMRLS